MPILGVLYIAAFAKLSAQSMVHGAKDNSVQSVCEIEHGTGLPATNKL